jgi:serine/threonine protein kinase
MSALEFLHSKGTSHENIKMENIICSYGMKIKLILFGFSSETEAENKYQGSVEY